MITLLSSLFIKNRTEYKNERVRRSYGVLCGILGIVLNILLCTVKFFAGALSGSIAITADAFNNLSDAASSCVSLAGFKLAGHKPDSEHPFGHGRLEYVSGLIIAIMIILMAWELFRESFDRVLHPNEIEINSIVIIILIISIITKIYIATYNFRIGKLIDSAAMRATGIDSSSDVLVTALVLICGIVSKLTGLRLDGYGGIIVALFVMWAGINAIRETLSPLLGKSPSPETVKEIEEIVMCSEHTEQGILGMHDLIVHDYGPGRVIISLDVEVSCNGDIMELHNIIDDIENDISERFGCHVTIHMDPVLVDDPETERMKAVLESIIHSANTDYSCELKFHDFRLVHEGAETRLAFDLVIPYDLKTPDEEITERITRDIRKVNPGYSCTIYTDKA
ncbi:MAG: cation diffusion facilitator family transporter [Lachnospiraceae bacterium]|nr:cation diffusion facilitator family transporter [Lachnospiraceae bacterium]